jgi:hypothetical protein
MIFVGFGFLMTFLRRYGYSAAGYNFFTSALIMLEAVLLIGAVQQVGCSDCFWGGVQLCGALQLWQLLGRLHLLCWRQ